MKKFCVLFLFIISNLNASLIDEYRSVIQQKIDRKQTIALKDVFPDFIMALSDRWAQGRNYQQYVAKIIELCKTIELTSSRIYENQVSQYKDSFAINADALVNGVRVKLRFVMVEDVKDVPYYALAVSVPQSFSIASHSQKLFAPFDSHLANRWIVLSLFDFRDIRLQSMIKTGINFLAELRNDKVPGLKKFNQLLTKLTGKKQKNIRFSGSIGLNALSALSYFATGSMPTSRQAIEMVSSFVQLRADVPINVDLYTNKQNDIERITFDSVNFLMQFGVRPKLSESYVSLGSNIGLGIGSTIRMKTKRNTKEIVLRGRTELKPTGVLLTGIMDGQWRKPFGIGWLTFGDFGIELPLSYAGLFIGGIGLRAHIAFGTSIVDLAGKMSVGLLTAAGLVMEGKIKNVSLQSIIQSFTPQSVQVPAIALRDAQLALALGDTIIADREYKQGLIIRADVGLDAINKRGGLELSIKESDGYYAIEGSAYLPKIESGFVQLSGVGRDGTIGSFDDGPLTTISYFIDPLFQKVPIARFTLNGAIKIGSIFEGIADLDFGSVQFVSGLFAGKGAALLTRLLQGQRARLYGKLFNKVGAQVTVLQIDKSDMQLGIQLEQTIATKWEESARRMLYDMQQEAIATIAHLDKKIDDIAQSLRATGKQTASNIELLAQEIAQLEHARDQAIIDCKQAPWYGKYVCAKVAWYQASILSLQDLQNKTVMRKTNIDLATNVTQKIADLQIFRSVAFKTLNTIRNILEGGIVAFGIERIVVQASANALSKGQTIVPATIYMNVLGHKRVIYDVAINLLNPLATTTNFLRAIKDIVDEDPLNKQLVPVLNAMQQPPKDYYAILGISKDATQTEIRAAYKQLLRRWHPQNVDLMSEGITADQALQKFQDIVEAHVRLAPIKQRTEPRIWEID